MTRWKAHENKIYVGPSINESDQIIAILDSQDRALARQIVRDHNRAIEFELATFDGKTCTYCHSVGACPKCWGRAALNYQAKAFEAMREALSNLIEAVDESKIKAGNIYKLKLEQALTEGSAVLAKGDL